VKLTGPHRLVPQLGKGATKLFATLYKKPTNHHFSGWPGSAGREMAGPGGKGTVAGTPVSPKERSLEKKKGKKPSKGRKRNKTVLQEGWGT